MLSGEIMPMMRSPSTTTALVFAPLMISSYTWTTFSRGDTTGACGSMICPTDTSVARAFMASTSAGRVTMPASLPS